MKIRISVKDNIHAFSVDSVYEAGKNILIIADRIQRYTNIPVTVSYGSGAFRKVKRSVTTGDADELGLYLRHRYLIRSDDQARISCVV